MLDHAQADPALALAMEQRAVDVLQAALEPGYGRSGASRPLDQFPTRRDGLLLHSAVLARSGLAVATLPRDDEGNVLMRDDNIWSFPGYEVEYRGPWLSRRDWTALRALIKLYGDQRAESVRSVSAYEVAKAMGIAPDGRTRDIHESVSRLSQVRLTVTIAPKMRSRIGPGSDKPWRQNNIRLVQVLPVDPSPLVVAGRPTIQSPVAYSFSQKLMDLYHEGNWFAMQIKPPPSHVAARIAEFALSHRHGMLNRSFHDLKNLCCASNMPDNTFSARLKAAAAELEPLGLRLESTSGQLSDRRFNCKRYNRR